MVGRNGFGVGTLTPFPAQFLVHLHLHDLRDNIPEQILNSHHDMGGTAKVLTLDILFQ